jgi:hypothetical protein
MPGTLAATHVFICISPSALAESETGPSQKQFEEEINANFVFGPVLTALTKIYDVKRGGWTEQALLRRTGEQLVTELLVILVPTGLFVVLGIIACRMVSSISSRNPGAPVEERNLKEPTQ